MPSGAGAGIKGLKIQDFKGEENNLQEDEKSKYLVNKCLSCSLPGIGPLSKSF